MKFAHILFYFLVFVLTVAVAHAQQPILTIHSDQPGVRVSPRLYGVFFEEINHAGDGGLYAELVRNRNFEEKSGANDSPPGWMLHTEGEAKATLALSRIPLLGDKLSGANGKYAKLRIDIHTASSGRVALVNEGYWGIAVRQGTVYQLSLRAFRDAMFRGPLTVSLEGRGGQIYARAEIKSLTAHWNRYNVRLTANADDPSARLVLSATTPGTLWLDFVSLFPADTFKKRPNGLRPDLANHVNAMHPAFVRFPGGCYVEGGEKLADAFHWSHTLGDIASRTGHENSIWGYRSTDGLGYHEYLQWCEDMGAEPLFVVNYYNWWNIGGWTNTEHAIEKSVAGSKMELSPHIKGSIETGKWYDIRVECQGPRIRCYLDEQLIADLQDRPVPDFTAIAGKVDKTGELIVKVVNGAENAREVTLNLTGSVALQPTGEAITLTSADMDDENSLTQPDRIVPVTTRLNGVGAKFTYIFPPRSLTILRLKPR